MEAMPKQLLRNDLRLGFYIHFYISRTSTLLRQGSLATQTKTQVVHVKNFPTLRQYPLFFNRAVFFVNNLQPVFVVRGAVRV